MQWYLWPEKCNADVETNWDESCSSFSQHMLLKWWWVMWASMSKWLSVQSVKEKWKVEGCWGQDLCARENSHFLLTSICTLTSDPNTRVSHHPPPLFQARSGLDGPCWRLAVFVVLWLMQKSSILNGFLWRRFTSGTDVLVFLCLKGGSRIFPSLWWSSLCDRWMQLHPEASVRVKQIDGGMTWH